MVDLIRGERLLQTIYTAGRRFGERNIFSCPLIEDSGIYGRGSLEKVDQLCGAIDAKMKRLTLGIKYRNVGKRANPVVIRFPVLQAPLDKGIGIDDRHSTTGNALQIRGWLLGSRVSRQEADGDKNGQLIFHGNDN